jgi:membrane protease subunit HflK
VCSSDLEAYRQRVVAQAEGDAQRFRSVLEEYQKAPAVTRDRLYLETMQQIYSNVSKVMVDSRNGSNLLYLPLDRLMQQAATAATTPAPSSASSTDNLPTPIGDQRARENQRTRERDSR